MFIAEWSIKDIGTRIGSSYELRSNSMKIFTIYFNRIYLLNILYGASDKIAIVIVVINGSSQNFLRICKIYKNKKSENLGSSVVIVFESLVKLLLRGEGFIYPPPKSK